MPGAPLSPHPLLSLVDRLLDGYTSVVGIAFRVQGCIHLCRMIGMQRFLWLLPVLSLQSLVFLLARTHLGNLYVAKNSKPELGPGNPAYFM